MPKKATPLTVKQVQQKRPPGMYADGHGLYLHVGKGDSRSWIFRYKLGDRRHDMGLGPLELVTLAEARDLALDLRRGLRQGIDPLEAKRHGNVKLRLERASALSFSDAAARYIAAHEAGWKDKRGWPDSMRLYVNPIIGDMPVAVVDFPAVMRVLEPIWHTKTKAAQNVRGRIESVLDWASAHGYRPQGDNPARWRGHLENVLPRPSRIAKVQHHKAVPYRDMPELLTLLHQHKGIAAAALEFIILTAARAGEVLGARWKEIDLRERVWIVPGERMKGGKEHRVPLSDAAMVVLNGLVPFKRDDEAHVFLGQRFGRPMSSPAVLDCLNIVRPGATVHGFRSSFRDWAAEQTNVPAEIAEMALAHVVGSKVEQAYRRTDMFAKRRSLMDAWARYCSEPSPKGEVVPLRA